MAAAAAGDDDDNDDDVVDYVMAVHILSNTAHLINNM